MAEWIGHFVSSVPQWLFLPFLILVIILIVLGWAMWALLNAASYGVDGWPFKIKTSIFRGEEK
jgi:hypothetical protein